MNPQYIAAGFVHTIPNKLGEYFIGPFSNILVILSLIIMFSNIYMFRKLRKIKFRDYIELANVITIGIYIVFAVISAVLVSRLGPHGNLYIDDCDLKYMFIPRTLFVIVAIINVICFVINIVTKIMKDNKEKETISRGYYAEENENRQTNENKRNENVSSFIDNIKQKIDVDVIKDKVNSVTEDIKDMVNSKIKKDE